MKLPLFRVLAASLAYGVGNAGLLLRILWLPALVSLAAQAILMPSVLDAQIEAMRQAIGGGEDEAAAAVASSTFPQMAIMSVVSGLCSLIMMVGVTKHVVRGEAPRWPFYFAFGADDLRIIIGLLLFGVISSGVALVFALIIFVFFSMVDSEPAALAQLVPLTIILPVLWLYIRMSVLVPATVAQREIGLGASWRASRGAFWKLLLLLLMTYFAASVVAIAMQIIVMPEAIGLYRGVLASATDQNAYNNALLEHNSTLRERLSLSGPASWLYLGYLYLSSILFAAVYAIVPAVAYRYLSQDDENSSMQT